MSAFATSPLANSDVLFDFLLVLILALLGGWLLMLAAAVMRCLRDGGNPAPARVALSDGEQALPSRG